MRIFLFFPTARASVKPVIEAPKPDPMMTISLWATGTGPSPFVSAVLRSHSAGGSQWHAANCVIEIANAHNLGVVQTSLGPAADKSAGFGSPLLSQQQLVIDVAVLDRENCAAERQVGNSVETYRCAFQNRVLPVVIHNKWGAVGSGCDADIDRHPSVSYTSAERFDTSHGKLTVHRHSMLVAPEPKHRPLDEFRQLLGRLRETAFERGIILMMTEHNQAAAVAVRLHGFA